MCLCVCVCACKCVVHLNLSALKSLPLAWPAMLCRRDRLVVVEERGGGAVQKYIASAEVPVWRGEASPSKYDGDMP